MKLVKKITTIWNSLVTRSALNDQNLENLALLRCPCILLACQLLNLSLNAHLQVNKMKAKDQRKLWTIRITINLNNVVLIKETTRQISKMNNVNKEEDLVGQIIATITKTRKRLIRTQLQLKRMLKWDLESNLNLVFNSSNPKLINKQLYSVVCLAWV